MSFENIKILGTSHISSSSIRSIRKAFESHTDLVCVELDPSRFAALVKKDKRISLKNVKSFGVRGFIIGVIGHLVQQKLGKIVGIEPGADMLTAIQLSAKHKLKVYFIDRDIRITLRKITQIPFKEKFRFFMDIILSPFSKKKVKIDISRVPSNKLIDKVMDLLKTRFPSLYNILVQERNQIMANRILTIAKKHPDSKMLVVVGAGHVDGINKILESKSEH